MRVDIALLLYDRADHARAVVDSLVQNGVSEVRAFVDHADTPEVRARQERMLDELVVRNDIRILLHRQERRLGLAGSVRFALHATFEEADAAILLEDDCVVRPGGIDFFVQGLTRLRHDRRIRSLCGYLFPCPFIRGNGEPLLLRRFCTWGWATWKDRWRDYTPELPLALERLAERDLRVEDLGADLAALCRSPEHLEGRADVWSVPWILQHYATGTYCVYPCDSLIDNIGFDGSGRNCLPTSAFSTEAAASVRGWSFGNLFHLVENEEMLRTFMDRHGLKTYPPAL